MNTAIEDDSTLTDRYQTTVPASVRRALKLKRRDRIHYTVRPNREVVLFRVSGEPRWPDFWHSWNATYRRIRRISLLLLLAPLLRLNT